MCGPVAGVGAAGVGVGTAMNAYGQGQGLKAMRDAWESQRQAQSGYDQQLSQRTAELIGGLGLEKATGKDQRQAVGGQMDAATRNAAAAQAKAGGRKKAGSRAGAEGRAVTAQAGQGSLASLLRDGRLAAIMAGLQQGGQNMDMLGRTYGMEAGNIRNDARQFASSVAPLQQQAAGMQGQWARQIGGLFNTLGQGAMMYGMSQPAGGTDAPTGAPDGQPWGQMVEPLNPGDFTGPNATRGVAVPRSY